MPEVAAKWPLNHGVVFHHENLQGGHARILKQLPHEYYRADGAI
jgi:hypothetical protein